jgi:hypothetical protein
MDTGDYGTLLFCPECYTSTIAERCINCGLQLVFPVEELCDKSMKDNSDNG